MIVATSIETVSARNRPLVGVIAGATATGKSALALAVAEALGATIINADASQVYADLRILSSRPAEAELARVPHRLYGTVDGAVAWSAAAWAADARAAIADAFAAGRLPLLVGGTGLYLRTLLDGIAAVPEIDSGVRAAVRALDPDAARAALAAADPAAAARLDPGDRQRIARALEVVRSTGRTLAAWHAAAAGGIAASHDIAALVVTRERAALYARCDARVDAMLAGGALAEVAALAVRCLPADRPILGAIGVPQLRAVLDGTETLAAARDGITQATRNYAKRQSTWWRNQQPGWAVLDAGATGAADRAKNFFAAAMTSGR